MPNFAETDAETTETMRRQAQRVVATLVKARARRFARRPMTLDVLMPGLSCARPDVLIAVARHLLETERSDLRRWFGFGGETTALNAKAALLLGRAMRRRQDVPR
jgi:hypothetical protein